MKQSRVGRETGVDSDETGPSGRPDDPVSIVVRDSLPASVVVRIFVLGTSLVVFVMLSALGFFAYSETKARNDLVYQQCVSGELRDSVIVSILKSIPKERRSQVVKDAISTLEPPGEPECFTPRQWWPW